MKKVDRHFKMLEIENKFIESIEEDILGEIRFDQIRFRRCFNFKTIHCNAFGKQAKNIEQLFISHKLPNLISEPNTDYDFMKFINYDFMKFINSLINCQGIDVILFQSELQPINLGELKIVWLDGYYSSIKIKSICEYAFYECDQLEMLSLEKNQIKFINENAFDFKNKNDKVLIINLSKNDFDESSFAVNSLSNFKRPIELVLKELKLQL